MEKNLKNAADIEFQKVYKAYYTPLYRFCLTKLADDRPAIDDVLQEAFLVYYNKLLEGSKIEYTYAYLLKITDIQIQRYFRDIKKQSRTISLDEVIKIPSSKDNLDEKIAFEQYSREFSAALRDDEAELFSMRYIEELDLNEIAELTGLSITNVSTRLNRIREKLRKRYGEDSEFT
ncbi:MAG: sigma-70 family RNA polymerase sigma factor [Eubacterium sp.]|nr:sigma-70 family RNA polymerase sigma factor [Eubacterium sp.]MBR1532595.1 sigma-70 family RNA polymerase sigma factor [Eubacterium sp.]